jgi:DNA modification methylase
MNQLPLFSQSKSVRDSYQPDAEIILYQGDTNNFIKTIPDSSVSLIITSPPYNLGKDYEKKSLWRLIWKPKPKFCENYLESCKIMEVFAGR